MVAWGTDEGVFERAHSSQASFQTLSEFRTALLNSRSSGQSGAAASTVPSQPAKGHPTVLIRHPLLCKYQLAYNSENRFYLCENKGKVNGMCCTGLAVTEVGKHLTDNLVKATSDRLPHAYRIKLSEKAAFERMLVDIHPDAALTREDLKAITPNPGQVGAIVGVGPPRDGYICKKCDRGYTTIGSGAHHWIDVHGNRPEDKPKKPDGTPGQYATLCMLVSDSNCNLLLTNFMSASGQVTYKKFSPPGKKTTRMKYSLEELRLMCFVLRCFWHKQYISASDHMASVASSGSEADSDEDDSTTEHDNNIVSEQRTPGMTHKTYCLVLTDSQLEAIENLSNLLETAKYNSTVLKRAVDVLAQTLYMPSNTADMAADEFVSPVRAMCCLRAVSLQGGFIHPKYITSNLVALQCGIRLCILWNAQKWLQEYRKSEEALQGDLWFQ